MITYYQRFIQRDSNIPKIYCPRRNNFHLLRGTLAEQRSGNHLGTDAHEHQHQGRGGQKWARTPNKGRKSRDTQERTRRTVHTRNTVARNSGCGTPPPEGENRSNAYCSIPVPPRNKIQKGGGKQEKKPLGREKPRRAGREVPVLCEIDVIVNLLTGDLQY